MHCKSCDKLLNEFEVKKTTPWGTPEELCSRCLTLSFLDDKDIDESSYNEGDDDVEPSYHEDDLNQHLYGGLFYEDQDE